MRSLLLGSSTISTARVAYGCMPLGGGWDRSAPGPEVLPAAVRALRAAIDAGITCFDHADIYCRGRSETIFAKAIAELGIRRDRMILQSKCGIRFGDDPVPGVPGRYDFSHDHIISAVDGILGRLGTDHLDILLLHRPDPLVEPDEVARAFDVLARSGRVLAFGVSNHNAMQLRLLTRHLRQRIVVNQLELSLVHSRLIDAGVTHNQGMVSDGSDNTVDYCRLNDITIQAWGPLARGRALGQATPPGAARTPAGDLADRVQALATLKGVSREAIAIAWLLRHPAGIQPVIGTRDPARIAAACQGDGVELSREEWYQLFIAGRGGPVP